MAAPLSHERLDLEWKVLRLLSDPTTDPTSRYGISLALEPSHFRQPSNRVVYEEIRALGAMPYDRFRELLLARVNNRGVPDFPFDSLFGSEGHWGSESANLTDSPRALRDLSQREAARSSEP